jgi:hypothetical protein
VLGLSSEVAVADCNNDRVQIFNSEGNYKRQFGTEGKEADGQLSKPVGLASDAHGNLPVIDNTNRLQVFDPEGKHLCTRSDLGLHGDSLKGIAWSLVERRWRDCSGRPRSTQGPCVAQCVVQPLFVNAGLIV